MANMTCQARSNYFRVKDKKAFLAWVATLQGVEVVTKGNTPIEADTTILFALLAGDDGWPNTRDDGKGDLVDFDLFDEIPAHLAEGCVAILMQAGWENMRYIFGLAIAINSEGAYVDVHLDHIYEKAKALGTEITNCEY